MPGFTNAYIPNTTIGPGAISTIGEAAKMFSPTKILVVTDAGLVKAGVLEPVKTALKTAGLKFEIFDACKEKPPISLLEKLKEVVKTGQYDLLIGVGGGSVIDSVKVVSVIAYNNMSVLDYVGTFFPAKVKGKIIPKIFAPTTAGTGSEWSQAAVAYEDDPGERLYPCNSVDNAADKVIIDPELTLSVPQKVTADTGIDALSHAIEAYTSGFANVYSDMLAGTSIKLIAENFRMAYAKGKQNKDARYNMAVAAAFAMAGSLASGPGLVHLLGDAIKIKVSHGAVCAILLPPVMEYNLISNPAKFAKLAEIMGEEISGLSIMDAAAKSVDCVRRLIKDLYLPQKLGDIGITEADVPKLARKADAINHEVIAMLNPRDANVEEITRVFRAAL
jgi:alcohol dehydrogenase class IV